MFDLAGRTALVTGAGQGVGAGIARVLAAAGAVVLVNDLDPGRAERVAGEVGGRPLPFDVADRAAVERAVASAGPVDILVNNAGIPPSMRPEQFRAQSPDDWAPYIDVNLYGVLHCVKATIDGMCDRGWGRVVTISSGAGTQGLGIGVALYAAGKGGGISFMRHLAVECARFGVTANTLALGLMERGDAAAESARTVTSGLVAGIPVGRLGTGADVGHCCVFLASDEASWVTGQTIGVNGGSSTS
jgi:NAD(P)-dependent dehydrogenase (short-subunit alcohol dehydrogenase family)